MPKGVIGMSAHWPSSLFVLAATFSLCLCQNYPLCWVLALGEGHPEAPPYKLVPSVECGQCWNKARRDLGTRNEAGLQLLCSFHSLWSPTSSEEQSWTFGFIQGKWILAVHSYCFFTIAHPSTFLALVTQQFLNGLSVQMCLSIVGSDFPPSCKVVFICSSIFSPKLKPFTFTTLITNNWNDVCVNYCKAHIRLLSSTMGKKVSIP